MKKLLFISIVLAIFSNSYAQNDSIRKPIECGTGRIMQLENERNQKIIEDFISASEKDTMFGNGLWATIGKQNTDEEILKAGLKGYNLDWSISDLVKSVERGDYKYLLLFHHNENGAPLKMIVLYDQNNFLFRTYDPYYFKNYQHPEVLGKWIMSEAFSPKEKPEITLKPVENELDYGYFLEIKEDYTFVMYDKGDCPAYVKISGRYSFDTERKITFYCNDIRYFGKKKKPKSFVSGPFGLTKEDGFLTFKN
ncbi:MAG: hypothetical protein EOO44_19645 [Flavobacterium sp.]|nr:MAG: hypothetical protein EOO44_19645 [Flavobacterium sp.]